VLASLPESFFLVQEAQTWDSGCTVCGEIPIYGAAGTGSSGDAGQLGFLLILVGLVIMGLVILRGSALSKASGYLAVLAGLVGIVSSIAAGYLSGGASEVAAVLPFVLLLIWAVSVAPRLFKLQKP
jgi:hypothetical protein